MQLHTFMLGIDVAQRALLLISIPPFRTSGAGKPAPKIITCILYKVMIPYGKCLVNYARGRVQGFSKVAFSRACWPLSMVACGDREDFLQFVRILPSLGEGKMRTNCKRE